MLSTQLAVFMARFRRHTFTNLNLICFSLPVHWIGLGGLHIFMDSAKRHMSKVSTAESNIVHLFNGAEMDSSLYRHCISCGYEL